MKNILSCAALLAVATGAIAGVSLESGCYQQAQTTNKKPPFFLLQTYYDDDLRQDVGGFVSYNNTKNRIPLVYADEIQEESSSQGQLTYQKYWLEIVDKRITGQYVQHGNLGGNAADKYVQYTNFRTNRITLFRVATIDSPCTTKQ